MSKLVVTDSTFSPLDIEAGVLENLGVSVEGHQCSSVGELLAIVQDADYVITQFAPVDSAVIEQMNQTRLIVRYGIGVDNVDLAAAREKGIPVCNVPDFCIDEVADHTLAFALAATRQVIANAEKVRRGEWGLAAPLESMKTLRSMTVGIVGFGRIGQSVCKRFLPFGANVQVFDPGVDHKVISAAGFRPVSLDELLSTSDLISLHCPANKHTHHLIDSAEIASMKRGVIIVNVARGSVVNSKSLAEGLSSGQVGFAALDVIEEEPAQPGDPLLCVDNVIIHSHIASASASAVVELRRQAALTVASAIQGKPLPNIVNGVTAPKAVENRSASNC